MRHALAWTACACACACAAAERPPHWVAEMHRGWAFELNAGRYGAAVDTMAAEGVLVPEGGVDIVAKGDAVAYFQGQPARRRMLVPSAVLASTGGGGGVLHTTGMDFVANTTYYIRMAREVESTGAGWKFDSIVLASKVVTPIEEEAPIPQWLADKLHGLRGLLEKRAFAAAVKAHFSADAVLVDDVDADVAWHGPQLVGYANIAAALERLIPSPTFARPHLFRVVAMKTTSDGNVHHLIAEQTSTLTGVVHRCYMRWVGRAADARVEVMMMSIGEGCEGPKCHGVGAVRETSSTPAWLAEAEHAYARAFTSGDIAAAAARHAEGGVIVPHDAARLIRAGGGHGEAYLRALRAAAPEMDLQARAVVQRPTRRLLGSEVTYHVLGVNRANEGAYYMRWVYHHDYAAEWRVGTAVFGVGEGMSSDATADSDSDSDDRADTTTITTTPPTWMTERLANMEALYNAGATTRFAAECFSDDALMATDVDRFIERDGIAAAVDAMRREWASAIKLRVVDAMAEHGDAWSMIGEAAPADADADADAPPAERFYMRWIYALPRDAWVADITISRVGDPAAWPLRGMSTRTGY